MNSNPGVSEVLGLLETLKSVVAGFAAREDALNNDVRAKSYAEQKAYETEMGRQGDAFELRKIGAAEAFQTAKHSAQTNFDKRNARITRAHSNVRNGIVDNATAEEARRRQEITEGRKQSEQQMEADKAAAEAAYHESARRVAELRPVWTELEKEARKAFRGIGAFAKLVDDENPPAHTPAHETQMLDEAQKLLDTSREKLKHAATGLIGSLFNRGKVEPVAKEIGGNLVKVRQLLDLSETQATARYQQDFAQAEINFNERKEAFNQQFKQTTRWAIEARNNGPSQVDDHAHALHKINERQFRARLEKLEHENVGMIARVKELAETDAAQLNTTHETATARLEAEAQVQWDALVNDWNAAIRPLYEQIRAAQAAAEEFFPTWETERFANWMPPKEFTNAAKFGSLDVDVQELAEAVPQDPRLALPGPANFSLPLSLTYPNEGSILIESGKTGGDEAVGVINNIIYRLLATTPPGKLSFTIFDPVGLGQNFAGLMHLADYESSNINSRIWTQQAQFEEKLAELNEHMEKVIQMYLRNEYATITEYNAQAGTIAEKYHILVVASFPVNFSDVAARRLRNIATSGARCGVYTLIQWDQRNNVPQDFVPDELRKNSVRLTRGDTTFSLANWRNPGAKLVLDPPPTPEFVTHFLHEVGERSKDSNRVEVPFEQIAPAEAEVWSEITTNEMRVPIGRSGATKLQYLAIGKDTRQHALVAGKTGSGKSTLFHVIITNLSLWCSPEEVEFYLVDFKKGVEFKCYATRKLPQAKVVAIESDREFGLSVLQRVDEELARRGDLFRKLGAQNIAGYKAAGGTEPMPRSLLIIDEFQEFFTEEDRISQGAAVLLDRIVRQGRAFGIHVLLGSQTLGGAYTLARATIGQMVIRIALQCNEADAYLIMDQDNPAPRLLSRPGEGIYNDTAGSIEGNNPFQVVWLSDSVRDGYLQKVRDRAGNPDAKYPGPFIFEGNAPADVRENYLLNALLKTPLTKAVASANTWLGAPNSIKGPTEALFQRQSGSNLLIVGQNDEATLTMLAVALVSLSAQYPAGRAKFVLLDSTVPGSPERDFLDRITSVIPHEVTRVKSGEVAETMNALAEELKHRGENQSDNTPEIFVLIHDLHNYKKLRQEDEFSFSSSNDGPQPAAILLSLINEGPARGIHVIATCDSYNNVNRYLGRKNLTEFEMRVLFQMSASDSASLIDSPDGAKLGLNRALFFNEREGYLETFRPYSKPGNDWIEMAAQSLAKATVPG